MPSLRETQEAFGRAVLHGDASGMEALVLGEGLSVAERVRIYANNCHIGFEQALAATYPVVQRLGGAEWFAQHAHAYQQRFPSRRGDLQYVGQHYAEYLESMLAATPHAYFSDVARLEWAYQEALVAADAPALDPAVLGGVPEDSYGLIRFIAHPSLRVVASAFPVLAIWQANQEDGTGAGTAISLADGPDLLVVVRRATHVEFRRLAEGEHALLALLLAGHTLGEAAGLVAQRHSGFDLPAGLRLLVSLDFFTTIEVHDAGPVAGVAQP